MKKLNKKQPDANDGIYWGLGVFKGGSDSKMVKLIIDNKEIKVVEKYNNS